MIQYWNVISIDNREATGYLGRLGDFFWRSNRVINEMMAPVIPSTYTSNTTFFEERLQKINLKTDTAGTTIDVALPLELLLAIADELEEYLDLLCFSLTCTTMWENTARLRYRSLYSKLRRHSWARTRIILLGDCARTLPEGVLSEEDKKELALEGNSDMLGNAFCAAAENFTQLEWKTISAHNDKRAQANIRLLEELSRFHSDERINRWIWFDRKDFRLGRPEGDRWMVRNLSKREYVIKSRSRNLTQVLFCLIGRSDDPSVSMSGGEWLINGTWAGDRIDVTLVSIHEQEHGDDPKWKDITADVKLKVMTLADEDGHDVEFE
ncbi:hypothetical protein F5050DRAFT_1846208 [Lentinula boryana]|uniref:F-box domain-containing protein n=1 Tax=Lentinula boryana TaxID=40481 RepID=A0ABQ8Q456_9AGAR|nr:hypothetical protein F5050DRAFT_1846208 [Lentinula boryana]